LKLLQQPLLFFFKILKIWLIERSRFELELKLEPEAELEHELELKPEPQFEISAPAPGGNLISAPRLLAPPPQHCY
jgi:hypothetical protein